jgi:hypothetical protein
LTDGSKIARGGGCKGSAPAFSGRNPESRFRMPRFRQLLSREPMCRECLPGIHAPEIRHMERLPDSGKHVRSKYRLKINLSACRFENKVQFCNPEKTVPDARSASDYFSVYATTIGLSLSSEHSSRLLILGFRFFLYSSGICGEQVPKKVSP